MNITLSQILIKISFFYLLFIYCFFTIFSLQNYKKKKYNKQQKQQQQHPQKGKPISMFSVNKEKSAMAKQKRRKINTQLYAKFLYMEMY